MVQTVWYHWIRGLAKHFLSKQTNFGSNPATVTDVVTMRNEDVTPHVQQSRGETSPVSKLYLHLSKCCFRCFSRPELSVQRERDNNPAAVAAVAAAAGDETSAEQKTCLGLLPVLWLGLQTKQVANYY